MTTQDISTPYLYGVAIDYTKAERRQRAEDGRRRIEVSDQDRWGHGTAGFGWRVVGFVTP